MPAPGPEISDRVLMTATEPKAVVTTTMGRSCGSPEAEDRSR